IQNFLAGPHPQTIPAAPYPASPFSISPETYEWWLQPAIPLTIATVYATSAHLANHFANGKPYAIAKTRAFKLFVLLHNLFLAVYSAWTFVGMTRAVHRSIKWDRGLPGAVDDFCNIQGDGKLWSEGLAFYGWWFYLSKFYEVIDTMVILAKGKKSSTLQTYHHTGAMLCMWAGVKYMAGPIWIFCVFNSAIHTLMYTYYFITAMRLPFPMFLKRSLTSLQITQFLVGGSAAASYLFIGLLPDGISKKHCLQTSGEVFAVILNVAYLTPLTYLFVRFFVDSYTKKGNSAKTATKNGAN
ncbi:hypothetical protein BJ508DRAFT_199404, partial [Ascobolus immersus RN42]